MRHATVAAMITALLGSASCGVGPGDGQAGSNLQPINGAAGKAGVGHAADAATHAYQITIENLTSGQPLSPGIIVAHTKAVSLFRKGSAASEGIRLIAEQGVPTAAEMMFSDSDGLVGGLSDAISTSGPIHRKGGPGSTTSSLMLAARANANRLSLALMLICTNDGFVGLDAVKLPGGFKPEVFYAKSYDAGTEQNNEMSTQLPDPCGAIGPVTLPADGNARVPTSGVIMPHPGIKGGADLSTSAHGWSDPAAKITVQRLD